MESQLLLERRVGVGDEVEVENRFTGSWSRGFVVAEAGPAGYWVRRCSDGTVLPAAFPAVALRLVRTR